MKARLCDALPHLTCDRGASPDRDAYPVIERFLRPPREDDTADGEALKEDDLIAISYSPACPKSIGDAFYPFDNGLFDVASDCAGSGALLLLPHDHHMTTPACPAALVPAVAACFEVSNVVEISIYEYENHTGPGADPTPSSASSAHPGGVIPGELLRSVHQNVKRLLNIRTDEQIHKSILITSTGIVVDGEEQYAVYVTEHNFMLIVLAASWNSSFEPALRDYIGQVIQQLYDCNRNVKIRAIITGAQASLGAVLEACGFTQCIDVLSLSVAPIKTLPGTDSPCSNLPLKMSDLYLLAGQSNMSGRGSLDEECIEETCSYLASLRDDALNDTNAFSTRSSSDRNSTRDNIFSFDPIDGWVNNRTNIHRNVDILKTTGLGPGISFAEELLLLQTSIGGGCAEAGGCVSVGLIPTAVGGTALSEWLPHSALVNGVLNRDEIMKPLPAVYASDDSSGSGGFEITAPANARYHTGCPNLLSCTMRTLFLAARMVHNVILGKFDKEDEMRQYVASEMLNPSNIGGILWYQGCNDAAESLEAAESLYPKRFRFLTDYIRRVVPYVARSALAAALRDLGKDVNSFTTAPLRDAAHTHNILKEIPVVAVAITSTRYWQLKYMRELRHYFLTQASIGIQGLAVVDALGAPLLPDCIHITTPAAIALGRLMAQSMVDLKYAKKQTSLRSFPVASAGYLGPEEVVAMYRRAAQEAVDDLSASKGFLKQYAVVPTLVQSADVLLSDDEKQDSKAMPDKSLLPVMKAPLKAVNFVYGETSVLGMLHVLNTNVPKLLSSSQHISAESDLCFVDLGCGNGTCVAAAALSGLFGRILGVEMMRAKANECRSMSEKLLASYNTEDCLRGRSKPIIEVVEGNFQSYRWWDVADVVYIVSTCFTDDVVEELAERCRVGLKRGALAIFVDKTPLSIDCFPSHAPAASAIQAAPESGIPAIAPAPTFRLAGNMQSRTSWGDACIYVYQKL